MHKLIALYLVAACGTAVAQTEIYNEDFQSGIPMTYTIVDNDNLSPHASVVEFTPAWIALEDPDFPGDTVAGATSYFDPSGRADRWLITPPVTLGANGNVLFWSGKSHDASFPDGYHVYVSTTDAQLTSFTDTIFTTNAELAEWNDHEVSLSAEGYDNMTVYIAFVNRTNDGFKLYLDDIRIEEGNPLGIADLSATDVRIYPNPAQDKIQINGTFESATLINGTGEELQQTKNNSIDLTKYESGVYYLLIKQKERVVMEKVIKL